MQLKSIAGKIANMSAEKPPVYNAASFEPALPTWGRGELAEYSRTVFLKAGALSAQLPSQVARVKAARLVREMNSYYSNLIEGHQTLPRDIEKALRHDFSSDPKRRANQHLARAHIEVETAMVERLRREPGLAIHAPEFIGWLHGEFYGRLPEELHWSENRSGAKYKIRPGQARDFEVQVGEHLPPIHSALAPMLARFAQVYGSKAVSATDQLIALAAAHHRLAWIHPFGDGNGRVIRLYSHAAMIRAGVDAVGLWTLSRGLARRRARYFSALREADQKRWNDLDGRGHLSDRALANFCRFFLETIIDQIDFMEGIFQFNNLSKRIDAHLQLELLSLGGRQRERLSRLLKAALVEGEIERGRAGEIVGVSASQAREITALAIKEGLMESATPKGALTLAFNATTLETYFPKLYQSSPSDSD